MQRYFIDSLDSTTEQVHITGDDYHHIVRVMRMEQGDKISVVFLNGKVAVCEIDNITNDYVSAQILHWEQSDRELPILLTVANGLLKGDKYDLVIQKGTELGANQFIPFMSERSVVKLDDKKAIKKLERWSKIAKEAAEQSERNKIPSIEKLCSFKELLTISENYTEKVVAYEESGRSNESTALLQVFKRLKPGDTLLIIFGPEGGFSDSEITALKEHSFTLCGLGPRILRAETAPLYSLAAASFYFELQR